MKSASGNCPCSASRRYSSRFSLQYRFWNRWIPAISFRMEQVPPTRDFHKMIHGFTMPFPGFSPS